MYLYISESTVTVSSVTDATQQSLSDANSPDVSDNSTDIAPGLHNYCNNIIMTII